MKIITWNPSETLKSKAIRISELKKNLTYKEVAKIPIFNYTKRYLQELNYLGKELTKQKDIDFDDKGVPSLSENHDQK